MLRFGFVSNSSSSSFILAVRNGHKVRPIDGGVFVTLASELTRYLLGCTLTSYAQIEHDKLVDECGDDYALVTDEWYAQDIKDTRERLRKKVDELLGDENLDDWQFHYGWAHSDGELCMQMLYNEQLSIKEKNVRLG